MKIEIKILLNLPYSTIERYKENNFSNSFDNCNNFLSNETPKVMYGRMFLAVEIYCKFKENESLKDLISECNNITAGKNKKLLEKLNFAKKLYSFLQENDFNTDSYSNGNISDDFYLDFEPISKNTLGKRYILNSCAGKDIINLEKQMLDLLSANVDLFNDKGIHVFPIAGCWGYHIDNKMDYLAQDFIQYRTLQLKKSIYNI